jgi:hypothetical protein
LHGIWCKAGCFLVQKAGEQEDEKESWTLDETLDGTTRSGAGLVEEAVGAGIKLLLHTSRLGQGEERWLATVPDVH